METIIIRTDAKKMKGLIAFLKAFNIPFKQKNESESTYDPEFVEKIKKARKEPGKHIKADNLWEDIK